MPDPEIPDSIKETLNSQVTKRLHQLGYEGDQVSDAKRAAWWWLQARIGAAKRRGGILSGWAVAWPGAGKAELVPYEVPVADPGEVSIAVETSFISPGTERAQYLRLPNTNVSFPMRPGYSAAGVVTHAGADVVGVVPGDRVAAVGAPHASVATVPAGQVFPVPHGVSARAASLVQIGVICGQGVRHAALRGGESVCGIGAGLIGTLAQRLALHAGAGVLNVVATSLTKEATARRSGAARVLLSGPDDADIGDLGADVVIEATGDPAAIEVAVRAAGRGGTVILLGSPRGTTSSVPLAGIRSKALRVVGAHVATLDHLSAVTGDDEKRREAEMFLEALAGGLDVGDLVAESIDPREAASFYRRLADDRGIIGACFDWQLLPESQRKRKGHLISLPDVTARGIFPDRRPLRPSSADPLGVGDPLAGAQGKVRFGLLGCGDIALLNAAALTAAPNTELVAAFDPVEALALDITGAHGGTVATSAEELLGRNDVDVVFLSVPHHLHAPLTMKAAEAGKHVVVEKPMANDLASAVEMASACERAGVTLSVCFPQRYAPEAMAARRLVEAGGLGELGGAYVAFMADKNPAYRFGGFSGRAFSDWRASREQAGGGVLIMNLCHHVDLLRHLTGVEIEEVSAIMPVSNDPAHDVEESISVGLRFENGATGTIFGAANVKGCWEQQLRFWGREGTVMVYPEPRFFTQRAVGGLRTSRWHTFGRLGASQERAVFLSRFATALTQGLAPDVGPEDGLADQAVVEAAYRSAFEGRPVRTADVRKEAGA